MSGYESGWMNLGLRAFRAAVRGFVETELLPHEDAWKRQRRIDRSAWQRAGSLGLLPTDVSERYGGGGGTFAHEAVIAEELVDGGANEIMKEIIARSL